MRFIQSEIDSHPSLWVFAFLCMNAIHNSWVIMTVVGWKIKHLIITRNHQFVYVIFVWGKPEAHLSQETAGDFENKNGGENRFQWRLNTGMAPTCHWRIKIVKINKLYLNTLLLSIVLPCVSRRNNEISMRVKALTCQTRNGYLHSEGNVAFLVQRGRSAMFWRWLP